MLGFVGNESFDYRSQYSADTVLDLSRKVKEESVDDERNSGGWLTSDEGSISPPPLSVVSPTLAITQRVLAAATTATGKSGTRPFKAYPKDPLALSSAHSDAYLQFRQHMLSQVKGSSPSASHTNRAKKRPGSPQHPTSSGGDSDDKDAAYWERRRKNNEAAKRSRDARRAKEDEIAIRAAFLEQENLKLKYQIAALTDETAKLRCMLYKSEPVHHPHHAAFPQHMTPPAHTFV